MVQAPCRGSRQTAHPIIGLGVCALALPIYHGVIVGRIGTRFLATFFGSVIGELGIGGAKARGGLLIAHLLLVFIVVELEPVEGVEGGSNRRVCSRIGLFETSFAVSCLLLPMFLYPIFVGLTLSFDVGDLIMREVACGSGYSCG